MNFFDCYYTHVGYGILALPKRRSDLLQILKLLPTTTWHAIILLINENERGSEMTAAAMQMRGATAGILQIATIQKVVRNNQQQLIPRK